MEALIFMDCRSVDSVKPRLPNHYVFVWTLIRFVNLKKMPKFIIREGPGYVLFPVYVLTAAWPNSKICVNLHTLEKNIFSPPLKWKNQTTRLINIDLTVFSTPLRLRKNTRRFFRPLYSLQPTVRKFNIVIVDCKNIFKLTQCVY